MTFGRCLYPQSSEHPRESTNGLCQHPPLPPKVHFLGGLKVRPAMRLTAETRDRQQFKSLYDVVGLVKITPLQQFKRVHCTITTIITTLSPFSLRACQTHNDHSSQCPDQKEENGHGSSPVSPIQHRLTGLTTPSHRTLS